jgi:hypothetical protein
LVGIFIPATAPTSEAANAIKLTTNSARDIIVPKSRRCIGLVWEGISVSMRWTLFRWRVIGAVHSPDSFTWTHLPCKPGNRLTCSVIHAKTNSSSSFNWIAGVSEGRRGSTPCYISFWRFVLLRAIRGAVFRIVQSVTYIGRTLDALGFGFKAVATRFCVIAMQFSICRKTGIVNSSRIIDRFQWARNRKERALQEPNFAIWWSANRPLLQLHSNQHCTQQR